MNFKKLGSVLSKKKILLLCMTRDGTQWAGDDFSLYELSGLPMFTVDTLLFTFGVNMAKKDTWFLKEDAFPAGYDTTPELETDQPIVLDDNSINYKGTEFCLLYVGSNKCFLLPARYLLPVYSDQMQLFLRTMPLTGETKIIAKEGMFVTALFEPISATEGFIKWLEGVCSAIR